MNVSGADAKLYDAIRLDSFERANNGELVMADDQTGEVAWITLLDGNPEQHKVTLGMHAIKIVRAGR